MHFVDLQTQYKKIHNEIQQGIQAVLEHGRYVMGPEIDRLETELANYIGAKYAVAVSSGTDALLLALLSLGIGRGDEVITSPFSFFATAEVIALIGAKPVFVDIDEKTYNLDAQLLEDAITDNTKVIMPVSLYGQCSDMDSINAIAHRHQLTVIEDGAQSYGARYKSGYSCNLSHIACTSFFPSKPLGCYGDGGACFTNDEAVYTKLKSLRDHGQQGRYHHVEIGINGRMSSIQAAVLLEKLKIFPHEVEMRQYFARQYDEQLQGWVQLPHIEASNTSTFAQYTISVDRREQLISHLQAHGIPSAVHYPKPMHLQPALQGQYDYHVGDFPKAERAAERVVSLPMHPYLADSEVTAVCQSIQAFMNQTTD